MADGCKCVDLFVGDTDGRMIFCDTSLFHLSQLISFKPTYFI
jgi:hypothetical protein